MSWKFFFAIKNIQRDKEIGYNVEELKYKYC